MTLLLGLDIGTSHCKAGLFRQDGVAVSLVSRDTMIHRDAQGYSTHDPDGLWSGICSCIREVMANCSPADIACIGIASFSEAGLVVDYHTGEPLTDFIPWFDRRSTEEADFLAKQDDPFGRFCKTGQRPNFKHSLAKLLWLHKHQQSWSNNGIWLSAADYIAFRLTGVVATDPTLATRTYAYRLDKGEWDEAWIQHLGFDPHLFPPVLPSGIPIGTTQGEGLAAIGLARGVPVSICGHDHICAAFAVGTLEPGDAFDSVGTAETLMGCMEARGFTEQDYQSGLAFGCHVVPERYVWIGGLPASGGSIEWLRRQLSDPPLSYESIQALCRLAGREPTGIYYLPYLSGAGAPAPDSTLAAAFIGLTLRHERPHLVKAVLEGSAYEMYAIQIAAEASLGQHVSQVVVAGGGTKFPDWMQIKADVSGNVLSMSHQSEATLLGAALLAGWRCGVYRTPAEAVQATRSALTTSQFYPDPQVHIVYQTLYNNGYLPSNRMLRQSSLTKPF